LIGNPYPAPVTFSNLTWAADNGTDAAPTAFYVYDGDNGAYTTRTTSDVIGIGQSFWVQASGDGTITFEEADKTTGADPFIRSANQPVFFAIKATDANGLWSNGIVGLHPEASDAWDAAYDAITFGAPQEEEHVQVWFETSSGQTLAIQTRSPHTTDPLALHVMAWTAGDYAFTLDSHYGAPDGLCLTLVDTWTGEAHELSTDAPVMIALEAEAVYDDRFYLHQHALPEPTVSATWCDGGEVDFGWDPTTTEGWTVAWTGTEVGSADGMGMFRNLAAGDYTFTWSLADGLCGGSAALVVPSVCQGDFNGNANRGSEDLLALLSKLAPGLSAADLAVYDCDCDGQMAIGDILSFLTFFGIPCDENQ
jgi:hypothetical protein